MTESAPCQAWEHNSLSEEPSASQVQRRWQQQILLQQASDPMKPAQHESTQPPPNKHPKPTTLTAMPKVLPIPWLQEHPRCLCFHLPMLWPLVAPHAAPPSPQPRQGTGLGARGKGTCPLAAWAAALSWGRKPLRARGLFETREPKCLLEGEKASHPHTALEPC